MIVLDVVCFDIRERTNLQRTKNSDYDAVVERKQACNIKNSEWLFNNLMPLEM